MRSALVNLSTNEVENIIVADPTIYNPPEGYKAAALPDDSPVAIGWFWNGSAFVDLNAPTEVTDGTLP